ncbi:unnamed protein product [Rotaria sp. Silwood1]|nr:unnamed protein product [Rotaria sp. Silwood1]CAF1674948.1 unnamed protein product [Rotaria sp. Silwood1]
MRIKCVLLRAMTFLLLDESERDNRLLSTSSKDIVAIDKINENSIKRTSGLICNLKQVQWEKNGKFSLRNILFDALPGDLICIIRPVGSGKSLLLQTLTGEITYSDGKDFVQLSHGANTLVGDQGVMLSGDQKAHVNMARVLYRDADIYLLDDPL